MEKAQQIVFSKISKAHMKVLQYLIKLKGLDFTISEVSRNISMTRVTLYKILEDLLDIGVIERTRRVGVTRLYKLNEDNSITKAIVNLYKAMLSTLNIKKVLRD